MEYLGYKKEEFEKATFTLEKISKYIKGGFLVVGGLGIRTLFPEFKKYQREEINDLDLVFYPAKKGRLLRPEIKDKFYIGYIAQENFGSREGFYFALIDKENFVKVDLFMPERDVKTQEIEIGRRKYNCPTKEEIYLNNLRDFWYLTNARVNIDSKWIEFLDFLEKEGDLNKKVIEEIWPEEKKAIRYYCKQEAEKKFNEKEELNRFIGEVAYREFNSFEEYKNTVRKRIKDNSDLFEPKKEKSLWEYPSHCPEGWGLEIEDEKTFEMIKEKWREMRR